jgi:hypothetical protein
MFNKLYLIENLEQTKDIPVVKRAKKENSRKKQGKEDFLLNLKNINHKNHKNHKTENVGLNEKFSQANHQGHYPSLNSGSKQMSNPLSS